MEKSNNVANFVVVVSSLIIASPIGSAQLALAMGLALSACITPEVSKAISSHGKTLLKFAVVLLGFRMNILEIVHVSWNSLGTTALSISLTLSLGIILGRLLKLDSYTYTLISSGTAICGGSAIAAVGSVLAASEAQISLSIACVFIYNAIALYLLPLAGNYFELSQSAFGELAGISIHDVSSVVGAASMYGNESLEIATTVKLARTLWIIPLCLLFSKFSVHAHSDTRKKSLPIPWFIVLYLLASIYMTTIGVLPVSVENLSLTAKTLFAISLLWIGLATSLKGIVIRAQKGLLLAGILWLAILFFGFTVIGV